MVQVNSPAHDDREPEINRVARWHRSVPADHPVHVRLSLCALPDKARQHSEDSRSNGTIRRHETVDRTLMSLPQAANTTPISTHQHSFSF